MLYFPQLTLFVSLCALTSCGIRPLDSAYQSLRPVAPAPQEKEILIRIVKPEMVNQALTAWQNQGALIIGKSQIRSRTILTESDIEAFCRRQNADFALVSQSILAYERTLQIIPQPLQEIREDASRKPVTKQIKQNNYAYVDVPLRDYDVVLFQRPFKAVDLPPGPVSGEAMPAKVKPTPTPPAGRPAAIPTTRKAIPYDSGTSYAPAKKLPITKTALPASKTPKSPERTIAAPSGETQQSIETSQTIQSTQTIVTGD